LTNGTTAGIDLDGCGPRRTWHVAGTSVRWLELPAKCSVLAKRWTSIFHLIDRPNFGPQLEGSAP